MLNSGQRGKLHMSISDTCPDKRYMDCDELLGETIRIRVYRANLGSKATRVS